MDAKITTFEEHKKQTSADCRATADKINKLADEIDSGDLKAFERFWMEGGTEEGDAKIFKIREIVVIRYLYREDQLSENA
jgi:hypothetical protein